MNFAEYIIHILFNHNHKNKYHILVYISPREIMCKREQEFCILPSLVLVRGNSSIIVKVSCREQMTTDWSDSERHA